MTWGDRVTFEVSSANPDDTPVWVDLTAYALHEAGFELSTGRQDNLDQTQPSSLTFSLRNDDDRFTFGNTSSPYAAWWGPGRKCRLRETYGSTVFDLFTGYLQVPVENQPTAKSAGQTVTVSAIDRLGRLAAAPTFVSTLGAHILGSVRSGALRGYWPLNDPEPGPTVVPAVGSVTGKIDFLESSTPPSTQLAEANFQAGGHPPGDDVNSLQFVYSFSGSTPTRAPEVDIQYSIANNEQIYLTAGQVATVVCWVNMTAAEITGMVDGIGINLVTIPSFGGWIALLSRVVDALSSHWHFAYFNGSSFTIDTANGTSNSTARWFPVAIRWGFTPNVLEIWVDGAQTTGTFTETVTSAYVSGLTPTFYGSQAHVQLYVGSTTDFTFADFTTQRDVGLLGLERQSTGDRIRTIAAYAGIPLAEYNDTVDKGTTIMQAARLAGKTPLEAMREAERTEQGLLYVDGSGRLVFKDRKTLYNV